MSTDPNRRMVRSLPPEDPLSIGRHTKAATQFSLRELLVAITAVSGVLAVLTQFGIFGALLAAVLLWAFTCRIFPWLRPNDVEFQESMFDFGWGVAMPIVCLVVDPFVFKFDDWPYQWVRSIGQSTLPGSGREFHDWSFIGYPLTAWQLTTLTVWLLTGRNARRWSAALAGSLLVGCAWFGVLSILLAVPALVFAIIGVGLLGYAPLVAFVSFRRQFFRARDIGWRFQTRRQAWLLASLGASAAIFFPIISGVIAWNLLR